VPLFSPTVPTAVDVPEPASRWVVRLIEHFGSALCRLIAHVDLPTRPEGYDESKRLPIVFVGNHRSLFDVVLGMRMMRRWDHSARLMVKGDFFERPAFGALLRALGAIPVTNGRGAKLAFDQAVEALRRGESVILMPEARIVHPEERPLGTGELVSTIGRLVAAAPCYVAITGLIGADVAWPSRGNFPSTRPWRRRPVVTIRSYIRDDLHVMPHKDITAVLTAELRAIVNRMEALHA
jgi:1-acyl-sn-glycerol-3-phosphate acyltransferase